MTCGLNGDRVSGRGGPAGAVAFGGDHSLTMNKLLTNDSIRHSTMIYPIRLSVIVVARW